MDTSSHDDLLKRWPRLIAFLKQLDQDVNSFGPLRATITKLVDCTGPCENALNEKQEYEAIKEELENIFEILNQHYGGDAPPEVTGSVESLCKEIDRELQFVKDKIVDEVAEVLGCYGRIRDHLQRILLNADTSMWRIAEVSATEDRLGRLLPTMSAYYNSPLATQLKRGPCTGDTQIIGLRKMIGWVVASSPGSLNWMVGLSETGRTAIVYSLCDNLAADGKLAASFFCSRLLPECRNVNRIIPSIAYQLARFSRPFCSVLSDVLEKDPNAYTPLSHLQFDALIVQPLLRVKNTLPENLVIVIDALDECVAKESTSRINDVLLTKSENLPVKFVVSSPPEPEIWDRMTEQSDQDTSRVVLHELDSHTVMLEFTPENPQV